MNCKMFQNVLDMFILRQLCCYINIKWKLLRYKTICGRPNIVLYWSYAGILMYKKLETKDL